MNINFRLCKNNSCRKVIEEEGKVTCKDCRERGRVRAERHRQQRRDEDARKAEITATAMAALEQLAATPNPSGSHLVTRERSSPLEKKLRIKPWLRDKQRSILLRNANLILPVTSAISEGVDILLSEGKVKSIQVSNPNRVIEEGDADLVVDLSGLYVCPGLIDSHVHVTAVPGVGTMKDAVSNLTLEMSWALY